MGNLLYHPAVVFALCFVCTWVLYQIGKSLAPVGQAAAGKTAIYACGEEATAPTRPIYNWFHIAFVFTLLDVGVLMIATIPAGVYLPLAAAWLVGGAAAILMLLRDWPPS